MRATTFVILLPLLLGACSIHSIDVQQGNLIEPAQLEKLKVGMDKNQARFVLGTPMVEDIFHGNRWDYVYSRRREGEALPDAEAELVGARRLGVILDRE